MNPDPSIPIIIIGEIHRLESLGYVGLLGSKYLAEALTTLDPETGNRVTFVNIDPAQGWAVVAYGGPDREVKCKFLKDIDLGWVYDGLETAGIGSLRLWEVRRIRP